MCRLLSSAGLRLVTYRLDPLGVSEACRRHGVSQGLAASFCSSSYTPPPLASCGESDMVVGLSESYLSLYRRL